MTDTTQVPVPVAIADVIKNPLLEKINKMPGATFRIPSKGLLYTNGEIDESVVNGELLIKPMTTIDEIYMRTPDMLFQGSAIDVVFKRTMPQIKKPLDLFVNDVDYLLTCLRKISYGNFIPINHKCTICGEVPDPKDKTKTVDRIHEYEVPIDYFLSQTKEIDANNTDNMKLLLSNGFTVMLRPAMMREMLEMYQITNKDDYDPEEQRDIQLKTLLMVIKSVDDVTDQKFIFEWLDALPIEIFEEFSGKIEAVNNWGTTFKYTFNCKDCHSPQSIDTVLNPLYFFILPSAPKTKNK